MSVTARFRVRIQVALVELTTPRCRILVLCVVNATSREDIVAEPVAWLGAHRLYDKVTTALSTFGDHELLDVIGREEVLVIAIGDAAEVEDELFLSKALIEADLCHVFLCCLDVLHLIILIHFLALFISI